MFEAKPRSVFWVVTTLVANAMVYTALAAVIMNCGTNLFMPRLMRIGSLAQALTSVAIVMLACTAATQHALHYIGKRAIIHQPRSCLVPTVASFGAATAGFLILLSWGSDGYDLLRLAVLGSMWLGINAVFAILTYRFFQRLTDKQARGFDVQPVRRVEPLEENRPAN